MGQCMQTKLGGSELGLFAWLAGRTVDHLSCITPIVLMDSSFLLGRTPEYYANLVK